MSVKPNTKGVVFVPGQRYMVNIETNQIFPYAKHMEDYNWMREFTPKYDMVKDDNFEDAVEVKAGDVEKDVEIEDVSVELNAKDLTPVQKRAITREKNKSLKG
jgi:hypothetical protein